MILSKFMNSPSWADSVFFLSYDEGGGPYDHVPPVPGHSNDKTNIATWAICRAAPDASRGSARQYSGHQHDCRQSG